MPLPHIFLPWPRSDDVVRTDRLESHYGGDLSTDPYGIAEGQAAPATMAVSAPDAAVRELPRHCRHCRDRQVRGEDHG
jgi:hypothetical protein